MANVEFSIEDLNEFDNDDIVDYLVSEIKAEEVSEKDLQKLKESLGYMGIKSSLNLVTTNDKVKFELFEKHFDDIPLDKLQDFIERFCS